MRTEFIPDCKSRKGAFAACPWAATCIKVDGGYRCFESSTDADTWANQR